MKTLIEIFSLLVIVVSIPGIYYFIGRIIATRGRWNDTYGEDDIRNMPPGKGITPPPSGRKRAR